MKVHLQLAMTRIQVVNGVSASDCLRCSETPPHSAKVKREINELPQKVHHVRAKDEARGDYRTSELQMIGVGSFAVASAAVRV